MPEDKKKEEGDSEKQQPKPFTIGESALDGPDVIEDFLKLSLNGTLEHASFRSDKGTITLTGVFVPNQSTKTEMEKALNQSLGGNADNVQVTIVIKE